MKHDLLRHGLLSYDLLSYVALAFLLANCTAAEPTAPPSSGQEEPEVHDATPEVARMTLSVRRVSQPGWSGRIIVASFTPGAARHIRVVPSERPAPLSQIVEGTSPPGTFAVIDGGFYDTDGAPMGLVRAGGLDHHTLGERGGSGVIIVDGDRPRIVHRDAYEASTTITEALQSVDRLVNEGSSLVSSGASNRRAARSAVAIDDAGTLHLTVAFDDRAVQEESEARIELGTESTRTGPTIAQWADLLMRAPEHGGVAAREALGLDGGFSTSMMVRSESRSLTVIAYHSTINGLLVSVNQGS